MKASTKIKMRRRIWWGDVAAQVAEAVAIVAFSVVAVWVFVNAAFPNTPI